MGAFWNAVIWLVGLAFVIWLASDHIPEIRDFLQRLGPRAGVHRAVRDLWSAIPGAMMQRVSSPPKKPRITLPVPTSRSPPTPAIPSPLVGTHLLGFSPKRDGFPPPTPSSRLAGVAAHQLPRFRLRDSALVPLHPTIVPA